jgi:hypothetical protein
MRRRRVMRLSSRLRGRPKLHVPERKSVHQQPTPITLGAAKEVGRVLRYVPSEAPIQGSYAFYM